MAKPRATKKSVKKSATKKSVRASTRKTKTTTKVSKKASKKASKVVKPQTYYHSEESSFTSHPEPGEPFGKIVTVDMKNGKGEKSEQILNKDGKPVRSSKTPLKNAVRIRVSVPSILPPPPFLGPGLFGAFAF